MRPFVLDKSALIASAVFSYCLCWCPMIADAADIIVNDSVPAVHHSLADTRAIFAMRQRVWPNGEQIKVFILADDHALHKDFVNNNLKMFPHQLRRVWDRMVYTGTGTAPIQLGSEQEMIEKVAATPYAIGYVDKIPDHAKIRLFDSR